MSLTAVSSLESAKRQFFLKSTYIMFRKLESNVFCLGVEMSITAISSLESARRKFFMNSTYIMSRKLESRFFGLRRPK